jgi:plasmid stabilization system protein ParE
MAFRVEFSPQAETDANAILEWLIERQAGAAGLRWFEKLTDAIAALSEFPSTVANSHPRTPLSLLNCANCSTAASRTFTACYLRSKATWFTCCVSDAADAAVWMNLTEPLYCESALKYVRSVRYLRGRGSAGRGGGRPEPALRALSDRRRGGEVAQVPRRVVDSADPGGSCGHGPH